jgi:hypothetical protein
MVAKPNQIASEVACRGVALLSVLGHAAIEDPADGQRQIRTDPVRGLGLFADDRRHRLGGRLALERLLAREHLVDDGPERELI